MPGRQNLKWSFQEYIFVPTAAQLIVVGPTTFPMFSVTQGWRVVQVDGHVTTAFTGGTPAMTVGDTAATDGYMDAGDITEGTAGIYAGQSSYFTSRFGKLYTADDVVNLYYTGHASTTAGAARFVCLQYRVF